MLAVGESLHNKKNSVHQRMTSSPRNTNTGSTLLTRFKDNTLRSNNQNNNSNLFRRFARLPLPLMLLILLFIAFCLVFISILFHAKSSKIFRFFHQQQQKKNSDDEQQQQHLLYDRNSPVGRMMRHRREQQQQDNFVGKNQNSDYSRHANQQKEQHSMFSRISSSISSWVMSLFASFSVESSSAQIRIGEDDDNDRSLEEQLKSNELLKLIEFSENTMVASSSEPFVQISSDDLNGQHSILYRSSRSLTSSKQRPKNIYEEALLLGRKLKATPSASPSISVVIPVQMHAQITQKFFSSLCSAVSSFHRSRNSDEEAEIIFSIADLDDKDAKAKFMSRLKKNTHNQGESDCFKRVHVVSPSTFYRAKNFTKKDEDDTSSAPSQLLLSKLVERYYQHDQEHTHHASSKEVGVPHGLLVFLGVSAASSSSSELVFLSPFVEISDPEFFLEEILLSRHHHHGNRSIRGNNKKNNNKNIARQCVLVEQDHQVGDSDSNDDAKILDAGWSLEISSASRNDQTFYDEMLHFANREFGTPLKAARINDSSSSPSSSTTIIDAISILHCASFNRKIFAQLFAEILEDDHRSNLAEELSRKNDHHQQGSSFFTMTSSSSSSSDTLLLLSPHLTTLTESDLSSNPHTFPKVQIRDRALKSLFSSIIIVESLLSAMTLDDVRRAGLEVRKQVRNAYLASGKAVSFYESLAPSSNSIMLEKSKLRLRSERNAILHRKFASSEEGKYSNREKQEKVNNNKEQQQKRLKGPPQVFSSYILNKVIQLAHEQTEQDLVDKIENDLEFADAHCIRNEKFYLSDYRMLDQVLKCATEDMLKRVDEARNVVNVIVPTISDHLLGWELSMRMRLMEEVDGDNNKNNDDIDDDNQNSKNTKDRRLFDVSSRARVRSLLHYHHHSASDPTTMLFDMTTVTNSGKHKNDDDSLQLLYSNMIDSIKSSVTPPSAMLSQIEGFEKYLDLCRTFHPAYRNDVFALSLVSSASSPDHHESSRLLKISIKDRHLVLTKDNTKMKKNKNENNNDATLYHIIWYSLCCGCCGFSSEIAHYVRTLSQSHLISLTQGPECFCPGLPEGFSGTLHRQQIHLDQMGSQSFLQEFSWIKRKVAEAGEASHQHHQQRQNTRIRNFFNRHSSSSSSSEKKPVSSSSSTQKAQTSSSSLIRFLQAQLHNQPEIIEKISSRKSSSTSPFSTTTAFKDKSEQEKLIWISHIDPPSFFQKGYFIRQKPSYVIGRTMYEMTRLPRNWDEYLDNNNFKNNINGEQNSGFSADELWVPSHFVRQVFLDAVKLHNLEFDRRQDEALIEIRKNTRLSSAAAGNKNSLTNNNAVASSRKRKRQYFASANLQHQQQVNSPILVNSDSTTYYVHRQQQSALKSTGGDYFGDVRATTSDDLQKSDFDEKYKYVTRKISLDPSKVIVIPEGIDTKFFSPETHSEKDALRFSENSKLDDDERWLNSYCNRDSYFVVSPKNNHQQQKFTTRVYEKHKGFPWSPLSLQEQEHEKQRRQNHANSSSSSSFVFFSNFKWEPRKGWDILFEAYFDAFFNTKNEMEDTTLVVLAYYFFPHGAPSSSWSVFNETQILLELHQRFPPEVLREKYGVRRLADMPRFCILSESVSEFELAQLFRGADAFVLPTRGEGWGLPTMQAMSMGLPTISTNWGGSVDFTTKETSFLIDLDGLEEIPRDSPYGWREGKKWVVPSMTHLSQIIRHLYDEDRRHPGKLKETIGKRARDHIVKNYDDEVVATIVDARLQEIREFV